MAKNNFIINSFVNGEVSPKFSGRSNLQQYNESCEKLFNCISEVQGGAGKRPGTRHERKIEIRNTGVTPAAAINIPFSGADGTKWQIICISNNPKTADTWYAINTYTGAKVSITYNPTAWTGVTTQFDSYYDVITLATMYDIQWAQTGDKLIVVSPNFRPFEINYTDTPAFTMKPYTPMTNTGDTEAWRSMPFQDPIVEVAAQELTLDLNGAGTDTISPSGSSTITFDSSWLGKFLKFTKGGTEAMVVMVITVSSSTSAIVARIGGTIAGVAATAYGAVGAATNYYEEGYWDASLGWPRSVTFFESRIVFGGNAAFPDTLWYSMVDNIYRLDTNKLVTDADYAVVADADMFSQTLKAEKLSKIQWLSPGKTIVAGTVQREYVVKGPDPAETIGPANKSSQAETAQGSMHTMSARLENTVVFIDKTTRVLREMVFNLAEDSFKSPDLSVLAEHMGRKHKANRLLLDVPGFKMLAKQNNIIWVLTSSGTLCAMTRDREQQVNGWHYHELAGYGYKPSSVQYDPHILFISAGEANRTVSGISSDSEEGGPDDLWMVVERAAANGSGRYLSLEQLWWPWDMDKIWDEYSAAWNPGQWYVENTGAARVPIYLDCAYLSDAATELGLTNNPGVITVPHGNGASVSVLCDGEYLGEFTVASGKIDISASIPDKLNAAQADDTWQVVVGFKYDSILIPTSPSVPAITGSSLGQVQRVHEIAVNFYNTIGASVGFATDLEDDSTPRWDPEEIVFPQGENQNEPYPMFTGIKTVTMPGGYNRKPRLLIQSDKPFPMNVTHVVAKMVVSE